jgi:hypothetical protein
MVWVRKAVVYLLSLVLFISLIGGALAVSTNMNLTHTDKLETWLSQSHFYSSVVDNTLHDAQQSASNDSGAGRVSLNDPQVQQAVKSVFSTTVLQQYATTFLNSNYDWLNGKTATPEFRIDLTASKQKLAQQIGQNVKTRLTGLQACSAAQLAQLQITLNSDPLTIPCQLPGITPQTAADQVTKQIAGSSDFLNNPVITAKALDPSGGQQGQPYYQKLSSLPKLYRLNLKLPWIFGGLVLISMLGILFISLSRRRGLRLIGFALLAAGLVLIVVKFVSDTVFNQLEKKVFNNSSIGQLQHSLTDFLHRLESQLVKVDLWFGISFLALAIILLVILRLTRDKSGRPKAKVPPKPKPSSSTDVSSGGQGSGERPPLPTLKRPVSTPPAKRPRLIQ